MIVNAFFVVKMTPHEIKWIMDELIRRNLEET